MMECLSKLIKLGMMSGIIILTAASCYNDNKEELYQNFQNDCDTSNTTYSATINPIITSNCAISGCHAGPTPQSGLDLNKVQDLQTIARDGRLMGRITGSAGSIMPPTGKLPQCEIDKIGKWVDNGSQNN